MGGRVNMICSTYHWIDIAWKFLIINCSLIYKYFKDMIDLPPRSFTRIPFLLSVGLCRQLTCVLPFTLELASCITASPLHTSVNNVHWTSPLHAITNLPYIAGWCDWGLYMYKYILNIRAYTGPLRQGGRWSSSFPTAGGRLFWNYKLPFTTHKYPGTPFTQVRKW